MDLRTSSQVHVPRLPPINNTFCQKPGFLVSRSQNLNHTTPRLLATTSLPSPGPR